MIGACGAREARSGLHRARTIRSVASLSSIAILACSSTAKVESTRHCDTLIASLPVGARCPPMPVGGFDRLAELVRYPKMFVRAGIEGTLWIELEVLPDSSGRILKVTGPAKGPREILAPIFDVIESLQWIQCSNPAAGDASEQPPVPFRIILDLEQGESPVDTAVALPDGGVRVLANQPRVRVDPNAPYPGRLIPKRG